MALEKPRLLASLTAAVLGAACSSTPPDHAPTQPEPGKPSAGAQDPQGVPDKVRDERTKALVQTYLEHAATLRANGDLGAAELELLRAKDLAPGNQEVLSMLRAVAAEQGRPAGTIRDYGEQMQERRQIGEDRARTEVLTKLQRAQQMSTERNYAGAIEELRVAALTMEVKTDMDWGPLTQQVQTAKSEAEKNYDQQQRQTQAEINAKQAEALRRNYAESEARKRATVDALIQQAQQAFEQRQFKRAQDLSQKALDAEPTNGIAYQMHTMAMKASRDDSTDEYFRDRSIQMRKMIEAEEDLRIPQTDVLRMDASTWERANNRALRTAETAAVDPQDQAVRDMVDTRQVGRLTYTEETGDFNEVIKNLSLITGVQIITTPKARDIITAESLKLQISLVQSMTLRNFLSHMIGRSQNLAWTVKNGVVVIGDKSEAAGTIVTKVLPVKDLIFKHTPFFPPRIRDIPGEGTEDTPRTGSEGEDAPAGIEIADLVTVLKEASDPKYWDTEGVDLRAEDAGFLTIKASPEMQARIESVLRDIRRNQTPIVTVDSKFLTISRNFMQEIGIDFRGLGGSGNKGSVVSLDDATNGLVSNSSRGLDNGGTGDPAANPLAGAFYNDGGDGDVRARTENFFTSDLGRVLSPTGGLTAGWTLIDDTQLQMILRAVEKRQDGEVVNSQILSVVNKGKGHVAVINQTAYVRDFDVEVAQAAFIADPKVDVIQDGIVLDVEPVILNDRKHILLKIDPTVAELQRPIPTFTTSLAGSTLPVTLQLPNLTVTNFSTTAHVPDGGTVLLGGLRQVLQRERRAEIPLLARLPLIAFFFKQEGMADENRSLMVMVRAQITDVIQDHPVFGAR